MLDSSVIWITLLVILCVFKESKSGTICLSCSNLADGEFCAGHEMCKNDEVCFIQKYSTNRNEYRYDVGCALPELCRKDLTGNIFGKRSDHSQVLCHKCCNNTDICNARLSCNDTVSVPQQKCLSCSEIEDPRMCQNTTTCGRDEICYLHKYSTASKQHLYDVGCKHSVLCTHGYTNILGRRLIAGVHQECESCCSGTALCNHDLHCDNNTQKTINSSCSTINECSGHLVCLSGLCQCPAQFYWNINTCIERHPVNERCANDHQCKKYLRCEQNKCMCTNNTFWNGSLCALKKTYNTTCTFPQECQSTMYCTHSICKCDHEDYWSGSVCLAKKTINSSCSTINECNGHLFCLSGLCQCPAQFYWNMNTCIEKKTYNTTCIFTQECQSTMYCTHGFCKCDHEDYWTGSVCLAKKPFNSTCSKNGECKIAFRCIKNTCKCLQTEVWDGIQCKRKIMECEDIQTNRDGVYTIYPDGSDRAVLVYCIMRQTKKWTVIQSRVNGSVDFYRTWSEYKLGFGSAYGEYWLGNDNIHLISSYGYHELSIYMERPNKEHQWGNYSLFYIADEKNKYVLTVAGFKGNTDDDALGRLDVGNANTQAFSTKDRDNDKSRSSNCAVSGKSGWWYNACEDSDLNKLYNGPTGDLYWSGFGTDISKSLMMIRRT